MKSSHAGPITLQNALAWYTDLLSPVSKSSVQALAAYADGEDAKRLTFLLSPEGQQEYKQWHAHSRNLLEVLQEFKSVKPPLGEFQDTTCFKFQATITHQDKVKRSIFCCWIWHTWRMCVFVEVF